MNCQANELPDHLAGQEAFLEDVSSIFTISSKWIAKQMHWLNEVIHNLNHRTPNPKVTILFNANKTKENTKNMQIHACEYKHAAWALDEEQSYALQASNFTCVLKKNAALQNKSTSPWLPSL